jgi:putative ABC transport system permease protein
VLSEELAQSLWGRRALAWVFATFAATALLLAVGGLYGVISYAVNQRRFEIGIRIAVGAGRRQVVRLVMRHGLLLTGAGLTLGLLAAWGLMRLLSSLLFGVSATEPLVYAASLFLLATAATAANLIPAWRASRLNPVQVLRS